MSKTPKKQSNPTPDTPVNDAVRAEALAKLKPASAANAPKASLVRVPRLGCHRYLPAHRVPAHVRGYGSCVPWGLWIAICSHGVGIAGGAFADG